MQGLGLRVWGIGFTVDTDSFLGGGRRVGVAPSSFGTRLQG